MSATTYNTLINFLSLLVSLKAVISLHSYIPHTSDLPTSEDTIVGTYADDTALLSVSSDHTIASQQIQTHLNNFSQWFTNWKIKINKSMSSFVTFTLRHHSCPAVSINNIDIPHSTEVKYLGLILDGRLTLSPHLKNKRKKLNSRLHLLDHSFVRT